MGRVGALAASVRSLASKESMLAESAGRSRHPAIRSITNGRCTAIAWRRGIRFAPLLAPLLVPLRGSESSWRIVTTIRDGKMTNPGSRVRPRPRECPVGTSRTVRCRSKPSRRECPHLRLLHRRSPRRPAPHSARRWRCPMNFNDVSSLHVSSLYVRTTVEKSLMSCETRPAKRTNASCSRSGLAFVSVGTCVVE